MPTVNIKKDLLFKALDKEFTDENFSYLCFEYGLELDEITSERKMLMKEQGKESSDNLSDDIIYRIDIPANRYDLLCLEGLSVALLVFQNRMPYPNYKALLPCDRNQTQSLIIKKDVKKIRPFAVAAVLRNITFTPESYASFIELQEKLHQNVARKRTLASIGTHDLDTIQGPFTYEALPPSDIKFKPLNQTKEFTAEELMDFYATHQQLKNYLPIIKDSPVYPVMKDANGVILSLPPIINGDHSKITLDTKNVFIEVTATDLHKANIVLDTLVTAFSIHCENKYTIEACEVRWANGSKHKTPDFSYRKETINSKKANKYIGTNIEAGEMATLLKRMCLQAKCSGGPDILVRIPPTRHDILHHVDIFEDVAISFGYNNIKRTLPITNTIAQQQPLNRLTDHLRYQIAQAGFSEALTFTLYMWGLPGPLHFTALFNGCPQHHIRCSKDDLSVKLRKPFDDKNIVQVSNPKTAEFQVVRNSLLPGLLKNTYHNKVHSLPLKIFEISDVVYCDTETEQGAKNERHLCAVFYSKKAGFEVLHGLLDRIMQLLEVPWSKKGGYCLNGVDDESFFPKRCAEILLKGTKIGNLGILHPEVLTAFDLNHPCSVLEINIERFL